MMNGFQKMLYKFGCIAPICSFLGIAIMIQDNRILWGMGLLLIGVLGCVYVVMLIKRCERELPILKIEVTNIAQSDASVIGYVLAYFVPIAGNVWEEGMVVWILIAVALIFLSLKANDLNFCPILIAANYHCYKASLSTGTECIVISKKKGVRSSNQIGEILRISDNLFLEAKGGRKNV